MYYIKYSFVQSIVIVVVWLNYVCKDNQTSAKEWERAEKKEKLICLFSWIAANPL